MAVARPRERMSLEEIERKLQPLGSYLERIRYLDRVIGRMERHYSRLSKGASSEEEKAAAQPSMRTSQFKSGLETLRFRLIRKMVDSMLASGIRPKQLAERGHPMHEQYRVAMEYYGLGSFSREDMLKAAALSRIYAAAASAFPSLEWKRRAKRALWASERFSKRAADTASQRIARLAYRGVEAP